MDEQKQTAFPLCWPFGWSRTPSDQRGKPAYKVTFGPALKHLLVELRLLGAEDVVISTNLSLTSQGLPGRDTVLMDEPGCAVYFTMKGRKLCMACDKWREVKANIRAVGLAIAALRQLERCGASDFLDRAFTGFTALPGPHAGSPWWQVLAVDEGAPVEEIIAAYKRARAAAHPDKGGTSEQFNEVEKAWASAKKARRFA